MCLGAQTSEKQCFRAAQTTKHLTGKQMRSTRPQTSRFLCRASRARLQTTTNMAAAMKRKAAACIVIALFTEDEEMPTRVPDRL